MFDVDLTMWDDQQERIQDVMWDDQQGRIQDVMWDDQQGMDLILHKVDQQEQI